MSDKRKEFTPISPAVSGFIVDGAIKSRKPITNAKREKLLITAINNEKL